MRPPQTSFRTLESQTLRYHCDVDHTSTQTNQQWSSQTQLLMKGTAPQIRTHFNSPSRVKEMVSSLWRGWIFSLPTQGKCNVISQQEDLMGKTGKPKRQDDRSDRNHFGCLVLCCPPITCNKWDQELRPETYKR